MLQGYCRTKTSPGGLAELDGLGRPFSEYIQRVPALHAFWDLEKNVLGGVHKLRLQDEVGRWPKNVRFVNVYTIENAGGYTRVGGQKKAKIFST